jgi:hypothetical protein
MDDVMKKGFMTMIIMVIFLLFSGCITDQTNNTSVINSVQPTSALISPLSSPVRNSIKIDPIQDFHTDSYFQINGSSLLNVSGTTDFPVGTLLHLHIRNVDQGNFVCQTVVRIVGDASGPNLFSYTYDMKGNPPGEYRVLLRDDSWIITTTSEFKIASELPYSAGITIDPLGTVVIGKDLTISGTTDLPKGSEIKIDTVIFLHPCPIHPIPDKDGKRSLCGGSCMDTGFSQQTVRVAAGMGNVNIWNTTVRTNDWCPTEAYRISATAVNYTNITPVWKLITL